VVVKRQSQLVLAAFLICAAGLSASPVISSRAVYPVPAIPHGQDWALALLPQPAIPQILLSLEEVMHIIPTAPPLRYDFTAREPGSSSRREKQSPLLTIGCILAAIILLLAGYDLIPRAHASTLRMRSLHLKQDLFT